MSFKLRYGERWVTFDLPTGYRPSFVVKDAGQRLLSPIEAVRKAFQTATGRRLRELTKRGSKVALIVDDVTRPTPISEVAPTVLKELEEADEVTVVMALGLHENPNHDAVYAKLGRRLAESVVMHNPRGELTLLGSTANNTRVYINRIVAEADVRVAIGTITPHPFAGFSGGPKILLPGVSGVKTIYDNHSLLNHPNASLGILKGNPVYLDEVYTASKLPTFIVNLVPSLSGGYIGATAGDAVAAHKQGVEQYAKQCLFNLPEPVDVAVTSSYPADVNLYQAWKGVFSVSQAVKPGGVIILAAPCREGMPKGKVEMVKRYQLHRKPLSELEPIVKGALPDYVFGLIYFKLRMEVEGKEVIVATSGMTEEQVEELGFKYAPSIEDALRLAKRRLSKAKVLINPFGAEAIVKPQPWLKRGARKTR